MVKSFFHRGDEEKFKELNYIPLSVLCFVSLGPLLICFGGLRRHFWIFFNKKSPFS